MISIQAIILPQKKKKKNSGYNKQWKKVYESKGIDLGNFFIIEKR